MLTQRRDTLPCTKRLYRTITRCNITYEPKSLTNDTKISTRDVNNDITCSLLLLPPEIQQYITSLDKDTYLKWPLLNKKAAQMTRFDTDLVPTGFWISWYRNGRIRWQRCDNMHKLYSRSGVLKEQCSYNDMGQAEGKCKEWFDNGKLYKRSFYRNGKKHGCCQVWRRNGFKLSQGHYRDGKKIGEHNYWHRNGQLYSKCEYKNGKKDGEYKQHHSNGQLQEHSYYINGLKDGVVTVMTDKGDLHSCSIYSKGVKEHGITVPK
mmetsp:Transcript_11848/g.13038  ORF Transcript_11848/g.13038 Transcript_11848/m.13038 type:complete len:263 (+) Transcript_11848:103-891(+)